MSHVVNQIVPAQTVIAAPPAIVQAANRLTFTSMGSGPPPEGRLYLASALSGSQSPPNCELTNSNYAKDH